MNITLWNVRKSKFLLIFVILSLVLGVSVVLVVMVSSAESVKNGERYEMVEYMLGSGLTRYGEAKLGKKLAKNEVISYKSGGSIFTISEFGKQSRYRCEGGCLCSEGSRRNILLGSRVAVSTVVGAASLFVAYGVAKNMFQDQCENTYSDHCEGHVSAEIDDCMFDVGEGEVLYDIRKENKQEIKKDDESEKKSWKCSGHCLDFEGAGYDKEQYKEALKKYGFCENMKLTEVVKMGPHLPITDVKAFFQLRHLHPFCLKESPMELSSEMKRKSEVMKKQVIEGKDEIGEEKSQGVLSLLDSLLNTGLSYCLGFSISDPDPSLNTQCEEITTEQPQLKE